jgi:hypothetical protein
LLNLLLTRVTIAALVHPITYQRTRKRAYAGAN